jgi:CRISPR-associated exonuclease Cas4
MEYSEDDYLMISGIQHFKFCRRQWALIHIEQQWAENVPYCTQEKLMHRKVHDRLCDRKEERYDLCTRALACFIQKIGRERRMRCGGISSNVKMV